MSVVDPQWKLRGRAGVGDAGNGANLLQQLVDEGQAPFEVLLAEQRRLEGQQLFASDPEIGIPQMLKCLQQQAATHPLLRPHLSSHSRIFVVPVAQASGP